MMVPAGTLEGRTGPFFPSFFAGAAPGFAFSTSEAVMRPPGPVPTTPARSIPRSSASDLASGDATMRSPVAAAAAGEADGAGEATGVGVDAAAGAAAGAAAEATGAETLPTSASFSTMRATGAPTSAVSPSSTKILPMKPLSKDSTSMSALSDSTTITMSPASTLSPSPFIHCTILPSFIVDDSAGIAIGVDGGPDAAGAAGAASAGAAAAAGASSPPFPMSASLATRTATVEPTSAASPSSTRILDR
mmetsp:Transcript_36629/g.73919  ORF Transcript_36629/g.73919 Transcript_36629/m.73919 type:complete len:248 (-) Transcript_36629:135-878(-)